MSAMLSVLLDFLVCGRSICAACTGCSTRVVKTLQDDDGDLWVDLAPCSSPPLPKNPPIPFVVLVPSDSDESYDDVSALYAYDPGVPRGNNGTTSSSPPSSKWAHYHDLELRIPVEDGGDQICAPPRLGQIPKRFFASKEDDSEFSGCDGSSYSSSYRKLFIPPPRTTRVVQLEKSWKTDSSDTTVQTMNYSLGFRMDLEL